MYEIKTGLARDKISKLMDAESWFNAKKAVELGFADKILFSDGQGGVTEGDVLNSVFGFGANDEGRMNYTSQIVVEEGASASMPVLENGLTYIADDGVDVKTATYKSIMPDGSVVYGDTPEGGAKKIAYVAKQWQMAKVPAERIPTIGPRMKRIPLVAEPRRIAVRYDQITAFQA